MRWLKRGFLACLVLFVVSVIALEIIVQTSRLPDGLHEPIQSTTVLYDADGGPLALLSGEQARHRVVGQLSTMGKWLPEVTVALEDHRFRHHAGVDFYAIAAAAWSDIRAGRLRRGGSTITQQLIKQELGKRGKQWRRKWREAVLAIKLERSWSKDAILEGYLNRLDYGNRRLGAESAALAYFGKRCAALSLAEAIYLAGLPQAPSRYNPWRNPESAERKYRRAVARLFAVGYLSEANTRELLASPPIPQQAEIPERASAFLDAMRREMGNGSIAGAITTSLKPSLQNLAETSLAEHLTTLDRRDVRNGAVVVLEHTSGKVRAIASFATEEARDTSAINAALVPRHAGSTLKPFVYQQALEEKKFTTASVLSDTAESLTTVYPSYDPKNYNRRYHGPVRLRVALASSLNIPAVLVAHEVGARSAFERLQEWGLREEDPFADDGAGFVLGNRQVRLLDLVRAYGTLARSGVPFKSLSFKEANSAAERLPIADPAACRLIEDILCDNEARGRSFGSRSLLDFPAGQRTAVKTGTSSNFRDAWVVGYNSRYVVGVWVGNLDGRSMDRAISVQVAGPIWRRVMNSLYAEEALRGLPPLGQERDGLQSLEIDTLTGLLPCEATRSTQTEWFLESTEPQEDGASWYQDGKIVLPNTYASWCASPHNHLNAITKNATEAWSILTPREGAHYIIDAALPRAQQALSFLTNHPQPDSIEWSINGKQVATGSWPLQPGEWTLQAHDASTSRTVSRRFVVEEE